VGKKESKPEVFAGQVFVGLYVSRLTLNPENAG
jgi:hypothetical protein